MVDLPAPFWPISACTSPAATLRLALRNAGTPPKLMPMSCISSSGERVRGECGVSLPDSVTGVLLMRVLLRVRARQAPCASGLACRGVVAVAEPCTPHKSEATVRAATGASLRTLPVTPRETRAGDSFDGCPQHRYRGDWPAMRETAFVATECVDIPLSARPSSLKLRVQPTRYQ